MGNIEEKIFPASIFCIVTAEFCERFSFAGLRTILALYLRNELLFSENVSAIIYHIFIMVCYIVPVVGAICADSFIGRYSTILYFSIIYVFGSIIMCLAAIPFSNISPIVLTVIGLGLIATGTGGTKPCVAAFAGDQFRIPSEEKLLIRFFSIFYFTINLGGFVGTIVTPLLRKSLTCYGEDTCYAFGFGLPAILMILSLAIFVMGKSCYRIKNPQDNLFWQFTLCTTHALIKKISSKNSKKQHWLDYSKGKYPDKLICDMKTLYAVFLLYTPLPIFWSLFDQQGSKWTFQASRMNGMVFGYQILPDQMQVINPALVLLMLPAFDKILCPILNKLRILECPLYRMAIGGLLAGFAFLAAGIVELFLETTYPHTPNKNAASLYFINTLPCSVHVYNPFNGLQELKQSEKHYFKNIIANGSVNYDILIDAPLLCGNLTLGNQKHKFRIFAEEYQIHTIVIGIDEKKHIKTFITDPVNFKKSLSGKSKIRIAYIPSSCENPDNVSISLTNSHGFSHVYFMGDSPTMPIAVSAYAELPTGRYQFTVHTNENSTLFQDKMELKLGGVYTLVIRERNHFVEFAKLYTMSPPNSITMMWLLPQYILISVAEIMFGVAGLEFSFTQAPRYFRTIILAVWYLSVALGNLLVIVITHAAFFKNQAHEFMLFAVLIVGIMMIFTEMAINYEFVKLEADSSFCFEKHHGQVPPIITNSKIVKDKSTLEATHDEELM